MALTSGTKLGPYEIIIPLGAGGMGEVYQARDTRLDRTVAIKILPAHLSDDAGRRQRFEREAKAISSLNHPHICTLYDIGRQDGVDFIVMEYVEGVTLAARLEKGPLPTAEVLEYAIQLSSALDKAHRNRVTHRDLKPGLPRGQRHEGVARPYYRDLIKVTFISVLSFTRVATLFFRYGSKIHSFTCCSIRERTSGVGVSCKDTAVIVPFFAISSVILIVYDPCAFSFTMMRSTPHMRQCTPRRLSFRAAQAQLP